VETLGPVPVLLMVRELGIGGTERQLTEIARGLDRSLFAPHVACFRATGFRAEELREAGVPLVRLPAGSLMKPSTLAGAFHFGQYLRKHKIQLVHTYDTPMNLFGVPAARLFRIPVVLSSQRAYRELTPPFGRRLLRLTDRLVDGIVVNCEALRRHLIEDERARASKIELCYNGIDTETFHSAAPPQPNLSEDRAPVIGVVCALRPEKDLATLIRAFASVRRIHQGIKLVIVGSGSAAGSLENLSRELQLGGSCHFEPAVRDVAPWMKAIDIFVLPSLSEALSNSLMEAMACGCCPVASDAGGNPELVIPMKTGLLFRKGDAADLESKLELLIRQVSLRQAMGAEAAALIARDFSLSASARRMAAIYLRFLALRI
jgi:glycosyltransferase involved in cell wall biosynthesis